jgi:hypothetical protein
MKSFVFFLTVFSMVFFTGCGYKADPKYDDSEAAVTNNK